MKMFELLTDSSKAEVLRAIGLYMKDDWAEEFEKAFPLDGDLDLVLVVLECMAEFIRLEVSRNEVLHADVQKEARSKAQNAAPDEFPWASAQWVLRRSKAIYGRHWAKCLGTLPSKVGSKEPQARGGRDVK